MKNLEVLTETKIPKRLFELSEFAKKSLSSMLQCHPKMRKSWYCQCRLDLRKSESCKKASAMQLAKPRKQETFSCLVIRRERQIDDINAFSMLDINPLFIDCYYISK